VSSVWVLTEVDGTTVAEASREALGEAAELARPDRPGALAVGSQTAVAPLAALGADGAGRAVLVDAPSAAETPEAAAARAAAWLGAEPGAERPIVLLGHTPWGRAVAPVLATHLDTALVPDAVAARRAGDGGLIVTRPAYGDRLYATVRVRAGQGAVVTLRPGVLGMAATEAGRAVALERVNGGPAPAVRAPRVRQVHAADPRQIDLREAERIVAGGRGVGGPEGFALLQELADLLGAAVGGSRVAVDLGWLPWERQIGQSGRVVSPRLYVACGISGASQHLWGLRGGGTVVAIDTDRRAPIMEIAHLAVVGDWRPVVAALVRRLRTRSMPGRAEG
jgi:electron transfer flavoprotein alpha subunit